jgi:hypothetical protein
MRPPPLPLRGGNLVAVGWGLVVETKREVGGGIGEGIDGTDVTLEGI